MDKRMFAEQLIDNVRSLAPTRVLGSRIYLERKQGKMQALCPFHGDTKMGSFVVSDRLGVWKCFSCGTGGDNPKFLALYEGINYIEAAFKLGLEYNIISYDDYEEYFAKRRFKKEDIDRIQRRYEAIDSKKWESNIADNKTLDKVFRMFIDCCKLSDEHKEHLMNVRGLSEDEIKNGQYFTFPTRKVLVEFCSRIRKDFGTEEVLSTIPGFYKEDSKKLVGQKSFTFSKHKGIGIGIKNALGQVVGIQIRHDEASMKNRYVWFSSAFANDDDRYECGTSSGSPVDVVFPEKVKNTTVFITEGRFKAEQIAKDTGSIALSVQGVSSWRGILKELEVVLTSPELLKRFDGESYRIHCLLVAFDADMNYKYQVAEQLKKMTDQLEQNSYFVYYLNWDESFGKGIDDVLMSGNRSQIKRYDKELWDPAYQIMLDKILENEPYENLAKVPQEVVKTYFLEYVKVPPLKANQLGIKHQIALGR